MGRQDSFVIVNRVDRLCRSWSVQTVSAVVGGCQGQRHTTEVTQLKAAAAADRQRKLAALCGSMRDSRGVDTSHILSLHNTSSLRTHIYTTVCPHKSSRTPPSGCGPLFQTSSLLQCRCIDLHSLQRQSVVTEWREMESPVHVTSSVSVGEVRNSWNDWTQKLLLQLCQRKEHCWFKKCVCACTRDEGTIDRTTSQDSSLFISNMHKYQWKSPIPRYTNLFVHCQCFFVYIKCQYHFLLTFLVRSFI